MGTGYVGGYNLINGLRLIVSPNSPNLSLNLANIDTFKSPYQVESFEATSYARFTVQMPLTTMVEPQRLLLWCNEAVVDLAIFSHVNSDSSLSTITCSDLVSYCDGNIHTFQVNNFENFTHIELQLYYGVSQYLDYPNIEKTANLAMLDAITDVTINLGSWVPGLKQWDVITDLTYGKLWRVQNVPQKNDAILNRYAWECRARVIQYYEVLGALYNSKPLQQRATLNQGYKPIVNTVATLPSL